MKTLALLVVILVCGAIGLTLYKIRTVEHDPAIWHLDPLTAESQLTPNHFRLAPQAMTELKVDQEAPIFTGNIQEIARAFDTFVLSQKDTTRIAGSVEQLWMTYVQRTPRLKIPDYISVKFIPLELADKSTVAIFSRSRFGNGDMGVNEGRVTAWMTSLDAFAE